MTSVGTVTLAWGNGEDQFCIAKYGELLALEDKCGCGVVEILTRLGDNRWRVNDIRETIRLGLIGGGMLPDKALALVKIYVDEQPLMRNAMIAYAILAAAVVGVPDDELGKPQAADAPTKAQVPSETMAASAAVSSSDLGPPSDGLPNKPTESPRGNWPPVSKDTTGPTPLTTESPHL